MLKFRTMQLGSEAALEESFQSAPDHIVTPKQYQKLLHDPHLTRVGRTLRCDPSNGHVLEDDEAMQYWTREYEPGWEPVV